MEPILRNIAINSRPLLLKIDSLRTRARLLANLRSMVALNPNHDILPVQWDILESTLAAASNKIRQQLRFYADKYFLEKDNLQFQQTLVNRLGEIEMELSAAYNFYDTYMDILTQRLSDEIGPMLIGCDKIALFALNRGDIGEITMPPLVYCDRGFGASTLREGVKLPGSNPNPIPFIAIPYSRISEKYNLISIFHEVGHQAIVKLNLVKIWQDIFYASLQKAGASQPICNLYANWSKELVPDFWAFCLSGMAQTCSLRDVLILPHNMMFQISENQPHPPSFLRLLISIGWCRYLWGKGLWDQWEHDWQQFYPIDRLGNTTKQLIGEAIENIPTIAKAMITTTFKKLGNKPITTLFDMKLIEPNLLLKSANLDTIKAPEFNLKPIGFQLAVFRMLRETRQHKQSEIDKLMHSWLVELVKKN